MFVDQLEVEEIKALMLLLVDIAKADSELDEAETDFLSAYAAENQVELDLEKEISLVDACKLFTTRKGKIVALQEIVKLAIVNGHYDQAERQGVAAIAEMLSIESKKVEEVEEWVVAGQQWVSQGYQIIND